MSGNPNIDVILKGVAKQSNKIVVDFIVWDEFFMDKEKISKRLRNLNFITPLRRQDAPEVYEMNASIYIWKRDAILNNDTLFSNKTSLHIMPEERSIDIDSELDWKFVEYIMKNYSNTND